MGNEKVDGGHNGGGVRTKEQATLLWEACKDNFEEGRHHEEQREKVCSMILLIAGGVLTVVKINNVEYADWPLTMFLIALGFFGAAFTLKNYERFRFHMKVAAVYQQELLDHFKSLNEFELDLKKLFEKARNQHKSDWTAALMPIRLHWFWFGIHLFILVLGAVLTEMALAKGNVP